MTMRYIHRLNKFPWFNTQRYWEEHLLSLKEQMAALHEPSLFWSQP